jgi:Carboxypeptidase regulatory-like domain
MQRHLILGIFSYLAMISFVLAQIATGVIRGTVQDSTGAILIDVHVMLVDQARNQSWEQTTNEEGFFEFRALPFGNYRVELKHPGFKKGVIEDVALQWRKRKV